ncbi:MAG: DUF3089 domain-containing protein [Saprospiraceae bacterium]|nr:DUF3089 domain-containing protein [Saprospiraceae bacterium]
MKNIIIVCAGIILISCKTYKPNNTYSDVNQKDIDYSKLDNWAAHPDKLDESDFTPEGDTVSYFEMDADVFFVHPTTYTGDKHEDQWNGNVDDSRLNKKTDEGTIRFQASAFNHAGRIFAPRYRQAHLNAYFTKDKESAGKAFDLAYVDVKKSFEYYLKNYNQGRPIIIASHSQGTDHAQKLLTDFFSGKPLKSKLIAAYLIGMPVKKDKYSDIKPCRDSTDTGCLISWRTFKKGFSFPKVPDSGNILVTNPLSWTTDTVYMPKTANIGTLLFDFHKIKRHTIDAQVNGDILWANKPKFRGSFLLRTKNYHIADINFYYFNIRENAVYRAENFKKLTAKK